jgi:hypothetical protein
MKSRSMPNLDLLNEYFQLSSESPSGLIWKKTYTVRTKQGSIAGSNQGAGYWAVKFFKQKYYTHRIIYYMHYQEDPGVHDIDHIDHDKGNNNALNLRLATRSQNMANTALKVTNTTGFKGVVWHKDKDKWSAQITVKYKHFNLGYFFTKEEAHTAYKEACTKYFNEYAHV